MKHLENSREAILLPRRLKACSATVTTRSYQTAPNSLTRQQTLFFSERAASGPEDSKRPGSPHCHPVPKVSPGATRPLPAQNNFGESLKRHLPPGPPVSSPAWPQTPRSVAWSSPPWPHYGESTVGATGPPPSGSERHGYTFDKRIPLKTSSLPFMHNDCFERTCFCLHEAWRALKIAKSTPVAAPKLLRIADR